MYKSLLDIVKCPVCEYTPLNLKSKCVIQDQVYEGTIYCLACNTQFPIIDGIPLLVDLIEQKRAIKYWNISNEYIKYTLNKTKQIAKLVQINSRGTNIALDAGCGSGTYTSIFRSKEIICIDLVPYYLKKLMQEYDGTAKLHCIIGNIIHLPFRRKSINYILCSDVLEHLNKRDINNTFDNFTKICNGTILVSVPNEYTTMVSFIRNGFKDMRLYKGRMDNPSDERLKHHSKISVSDLKNMNFDVHGCIGWVTRRNIRIGPLWDLYDHIVWKYPHLGGTLIGIKYP